MKKVNIKPFELFRGEHEDYYKGIRTIKLIDDEIEYIFFDYYNCYPENPESEDVEILNLWKTKSTLKLSDDFIQTYSGSFGIPIKYALIKSIKRKYLILICDEEIQPTIYKSCIEELWIVEDFENVF